MQILFIGDIVGKPGRRIVKTDLSKVLDRYPADLVIANGENAAGGLGINAVIARELFTAGVDVLTMGNHTWSKREIFQSIDSEPRIVRPANVSGNWPGADHWVLRKEPGALVVNLLGQVFMDPADNPFHYMEAHLDQWKEEAGTRIVVVDFHAEASAEKAAFARYFDGRISLVVGTHTHVQTADETILERGTAYITDVGMTWPRDGVIGMEPVSSLRRFVDRLPAPFEVARGPAMLNAVSITVDETTGQTTQIERIQWHEGQ